MDQVVSISQLDSGTPAYDRIIYVLTIPWLDISVENRFPSWFKVDIFVEHFAAIRDCPKAVVTTGQSRGKRFDRRPSNRVELFATGRRMVELARGHGPG